MAAVGSPRTIQFADFTADLQLKELRRHGIRLKLPGQPFAVLAMLLERSGEVVTRDELRARLWQQETFVDFDHSLNVAINKLRDALGDSVHAARFIETIPRTGYRFVAPVTAVITADGAGTPAPPEPSAVTAAQPHSSDLPAAALPDTSAWGRVRWYAAGCVVVLLCLAGAYAVRRSVGRTAIAPRPKLMLAVLPFENLTGDAANDYFSDGLTEEMITDLAALQPNRLGVVARTSVMSYKHGDNSIERVGSQLGVEYVVEGSVRQSQGRVRITAQLVQVKDQTHLWAQDYDRDLGDMLTMEREVCGDIAREIELQLTPQQRADLAQPRKIDPEAHELYLKGRFFWNKRTMLGYQKSIEYFNGAIERNPNYAEAWYADGYLSTMGRLEESLAELRIAQRLDPLSLVILTDIGKTLFFERRYDEAIAQLRAVLEMDPHAFLAHGWILKVYLEKGMYDQALEIMSWEEAAKDTVRYGNYLQDLATVRGKMGDRAGSRRALTQLLDLSRREHFDPGGTAVDYLAVGDTDQAMAWLERAFAAHSNYVTTFRVWSVYDPLRADPRFAALERRAKLIEYNFPPRSAPSTSR